MEIIYVLFIYWGSHLGKEYIVFDDKNKCEIVRQHIINKSDEKLQGFWLISECEIAGEQNEKN